MREISKKMPNSIHRSILLARKKIENLNLNFHVTVWNGVRSDLGSLANITAKVAMIAKGTFNVQDTFPYYSILIVGSFLVVCMHNCSWHLIWKSSLFGKSRSSHSIFSWTKFVHEDDLGELASEVSSPDFFTIITRLCVYLWMYYVAVCVRWHRCALLTYALNKNGFLVVFPLYRMRYFFQPLYSRLTAQTMVLS